jgi:hypothetical protein
MSLTLGYFEKTRQHIAVFSDIDSANGRNLNGCIEHLSHDRPLLMSVAPHVKLLRRAM